VAAALWRLRKLIKTLPPIAGRQIAHTEVEYGDRGWRVLDKESEFLFAGLHIHRRVFAQKLSLAVAFSCGSKTDICQYTRLAKGIFKVRQVKDYVGDEKLTSPAGWLPMNQ
jgi:hypothetical protein